MKNIIPFKKEVIFKTNLSEITSISLEHTLSIDNNNILGEFIISGDYKITDKSTTTESFNINIPFDINIDEKYNSKKATIDIDDFYYEIINDNILSISIDVLVDKLEEIIIVENNDITEFKETTKQKEMLNRDDKDNLDENNSYEDKIKDIKGNIIEKTEIPENTIDVKEKIDSLFNKFNEGETFVSYSVCIVREGDNLETIIEKYGVSEEILKKYNNFQDLKIGDKLIIPDINEKD